MPKSQDKDAVRIAEKLARTVYEFLNRIPTWGAPMGIEYQTARVLEVHYSGKCFVIRVTIKES